jgi:transcriptional regulator with XRE-family HTH domain
MYTLAQLGELIRAHRESREQSQEDVAAACGAGVNRSMVAHLEQGRRLPGAVALGAIAAHLGIPEQLWGPLTQPEFQRRLAFEQSLGELAGLLVSLGAHDEATVKAAERHIADLFEKDLTKDQAWDAFNAILVYYGVTPTSKGFFERYLGPDAVKSREAFEKAVRRYQSDAIRLYSTLADAYARLNAASSLDRELTPLAPRVDDHYRERTTWDIIERIPDDRLPDLGYISAARVRKEQAERQVLSTFLRELAARIRIDRKTALDGIGEKKKRKMDSLLRQFHSGLSHGLFSPLFAPDADQLEREADVVAPKDERDLARMAETQNAAQRNLAHYLAADHLDVYVATSMRTDADFVSVNDFVTQLFSHEDVRPLHLRYFNPTQSWIDDRVAKGLVEALMLKRSTLTIYMAQKDDTFGKDSEASVALGQGKPVIVYVPKLMAPDLDIDSEALGRLSRAELVARVQAEGSEEDKDIDETVDHQALFARILELRLTKASSDVITGIAQRYWAEYDLYGEAARVPDEDARAQYRSWLDALTKANRREPLPAGVSEYFVKMLVSTTVRYEQRAKVFREVHPLALQVILSSGVLNGILVARSVDACAALLKALVRNELLVELEVDDNNYRLIEKLTGSTIRVISRHQLIGNAFSTFYRLPS